MKSGLYVFGVGILALALFWAASAQLTQIPPSSSGGPPTGPAGGDLSGTYPNPTVSGVNGAAVPLSATVIGSNASRQLIAGPTATTVNTITCTLGGSCTVAAVPSGTAGGDLSGSYPNPGVAQVNGAAVPLSQTVVGTNASRQFVAAPSTITVNGTTCTLGSSCTPATGPATGATFGWIGVWTPATSVTGSATTNINITGNATSTPTEANAQIPIGVTCTAKNMTVNLANAGGSQPASGSLVFTLRVNAASPASGLVVTIPANTASPGVFQDTTHSVSIAATDLLDYRIVNNATLTSVVFNSVSFTCY